MEKTIALIANDKRMIYLSEILAQENRVIILNKDTDDFQERLKQCDIVLKPIPCSYELSKKIDELAQKSEVEVIDLMQNEGLTVLNTIATAEGTVEVAMKRTERIIQGSNILVLGFGRVGKVVAQKFSALLAKVTCAARRKDVFAWIETCGYDYIDINNMDSELGNFDIIINTVPTLILNRNRLKKLKKSCLVVDLASKPGGVDREAIHELGINFEWALALPGKVAPITSAEFIKRNLF